MGDHPVDPINELLENAPVAYLVTDGEGRIRTLNPAARSLFSMSAGEGIGVDLSGLFRDGAAFSDRLELLARGEGVTLWETELVPPASDPITAVVSARSTGGSGRSGEVHWILAERERSRELHREQAARVAMERVVRRARYVSEASRRLMGVVDPPEVWRTAAEIVAEYSPGVTLLELVAEETVQVRAVAGTAVRQERFEPLAERVIDLRSDEASPLGVAPSRIAAAMTRAEPGLETARDSTPYLVIPLRAHVSARGAMIVQLDPEANVREEMLVSSHVAERIALALETAVLFQEVVRARRGAEAAGAAEADLLAVVSHELRTPLTAIVSYAELLEQRADELPEKMARYARQIAAAASHQRQLVEQILSYRRLQLGEDKIEPEPLDFRQAAQFALAMTRPSARDKPIDLVLDLPDEPVRGTADMGKLRQVLTNLLSNAIRHTSEGRVRLALRPEGRWVVFEVEDTGEGIDADALPRIFDRFWRGRAPDGEPGGSGLGLTITRELVNRMGGEISARSEPGVGTWFVVRLPLNA